jgi:hypothetical protein
MRRRKALRFSARHDDPLIELKTVIAGPRPGDPWDRTKRQKRQ